MVKKVILIGTVIVFLALSSCKTTTSLSNGQLKRLDKALIGKWVGSETGNQLEDVKREWEMTRNSDGTFVLNFKTYFADDISEDTETGYWWTKNGKFYEYHSGEKTDIYFYEVLNENEVKFIAKKIKAYFEGDASYEFIDTRKVE